jgi:NitT/TauT family transport system substrate-binding protein
MKLTPFAKIFLTLVILVVVGVGVSHFYGDQIKAWVNQGKTTGGTTGTTGDNSVGRNDFQDLQSSNVPDPAHNAQVSGVSGGNVGKGKLARQLVVGINTWAGHAPGVVFNHGMDPNPDSHYKKDFGMDVKFVLLEDPAAKLAAFKKGDIDIMWDTVDNWAREASILSEGSVHGKSVMLQDWSRGGDGIVSLASINSIEDLKGKKISCTQFTPSHFLLLYLLSQSGLSNEDRAAVEKNIIFSQDAPAAAAMFKAKQVDAAVTWEPDLSGAVEARGAEAHVLVSTMAATQVIADTLIARDDLINQAPETVRDFVHGWFKGMDMMHDDPAGTNHIVADALKLDDDTVSGMLSGLKLTQYADNAAIYGLSGGKSHFETLFNTAFVIWRKKGLVNRPVDAKDWADTDFVRALADAYQGQKVAEPAIPAHNPSAKDRAIINKQIQIYFTPGSDQIMEGSYFVLDALGDTMVSFGNTYLRVEGNTDATGSAAVNLDLSQKRAAAVRAYLVKNFPEIQATRFQTIGKGATNPVASNSTEAGRQLNRRTDIKVILATQ